MAYTYAGETTSRVPAEQNDALYYSQSEVLSSLSPLNLYGDYIKQLIKATDLALYGKKS